VVSSRVLRKEMVVTSSWPQDLEMPLSVGSIDAPSPVGLPLSPRSRTLGKNCYSDLTYKDYNF